MLLLIVCLISASVVELFYSRNLTASYKTNNRIYNKILDRDWFSARLFVT